MLINSQECTLLACHQCLIVCHSLQIMLITSKQCLFTHNIADSHFWAKGSALLLPQLKLSLSVKQYINGFIHTFTDFVNMLFLNFKQDLAILDQIIHCSSCQSRQNRMIGLDLTDALFCIHDLARQSVSLVHFYEVF